VATPPDPLAKYDRMASEMEEARSVGREVIYRVVVLSGATVAFSATLLSIQNLDLKLDEHLLRDSWILFAVVIFLGPLSLFLESRARYAITWRSIQAQEFERRKSSGQEKLQLFGVVLYTLLVRPRNLIFVRDTDYGDKEKAWLNARMIQRLHFVWDLALGLELVFWLVFVAALALLIASVTP
jgi:hypothetical protein